MNKLHRAVFSIFRTPQGKELLEMLRDREDSSSMSGNKDGESLSLNLAYREGRRDLLREIKRIVEQGEKNNE